MTLAALKFRPIVPLIDEVIGCLTAYKFIPEFSYANLTSYTYSVGYTTSKVPISHRCFA